MGQCYEKLGKVEARTAYERVLREYADQPEAAEARTRLAELMKAAPTTMSTRRAWAGPDVDILGGISPDSRLLSFVDWETGDLALRDLTTNEKRRLTKKGTWTESVEFAEFSVVSPDSKQVAYAWYNKDNFFDLRLIAVEGAAPAPRVLYRAEDVQYVQPYDWSPDGKQILALLERKHRTTEVALISVADGSSRMLKSFGSQIYPYKMSFSPDGRYVAYDFPPKEDSSDRDIYVLATDSGRAVPLVQHPANDLFPVWAPDGKRVLFGSDRTGAISAWVIRVAEGKPAGAPELIKSDLGRATPMGFTRKGALYYGVQIGITDVYIATLDPDTGKVLAPPAPAAPRFIGSHPGPAWSVDGRYLAYSAQRFFMQSRSLTIRALETGQERTLSLNLMAFSGARWAPDGRSLLGRGMDLGGRDGIFRMDAQTGETSPVALSDQGKTVYMQAVLSPDGKAAFCILYNVAQKTFSLVVRNLETSQDQEKVLYQSAARNLRLDLSPDGQQLVVMEFDPSARGNIVRILPVAGGEARELLRVLQPEIILGTPVFTTDGRYLLFAKRPGQAPNTELWRVPVAGGEPQKLDLAMDMLRDVRVHPDGRRIAFTGGQDKTEVWVMENFLPPLKARK